MTRRVIAAAMSLCLVSLSASLSATTVGGTQPATTASIVAMIGVIVFASMCVAFGLLLYSQRANVAAVRIRSR